MKKILFFVSALVVSTMVLADCGFWNDGGGFMSYTNEGENGVMYCNAKDVKALDAGTTNSFVITSFTAKVWKKDGSNIKEIWMFYRLGEKGKIDSLKAVWKSDLESSDQSVNQEWGLYDLKIDVTDTLKNGEYVLNYWFKGITNDQPIYYSNDSKNYQVKMKVDKTTARRYYIVGNGKADSEWCCGKEWDTVGCPLDDATYSITFSQLPVAEYKFKISNGTWKKSYGLSAINCKSSTSGFVGDSDGNIVFTPLAQSDVTIKFDVETKKITLLVPAGLKEMYASSVPSRCSDVMMQAFYWDSYAVSEDTPGTDKYGDTRWKTLLGKSGEIGAYFDLIWLPPSAKASGTGYHPKQYSNQSSDWGSRAELQELINAFHNTGTRVVADMVVNHMDASGAWCDLSTQNFGSYGIFVPDSTWISCDDEMNWEENKPDTLAGECWGKAKGEHEDAPWYDGQNEANYTAARDWAHANPKVQEMCRAYTKWMRNEMGYDGFRYDYCKGLHASHFDDYNRAGEAYISFMELWASNDAMKQAIQDANFNTMALDFQSKYSWVDELGKWGNYVGRGWGLAADDFWKKYAVVWLDSHDNFLRGNGGEFGGEDGKSMDPGLKHDRLMQANALMLSMPGIPCVFYPHWYKYSEEIKPMINARHCAGVHNESEVKDEIWDKDGDFNKGYQATIVGTNGFIVLQLGTKATTESWDPSLTLMASGTGYSVWVKVDDPVAPRLIVTPSTAFEDSIAGVNVKITAAGGTSKTPAIYYTLDGTEPTTASFKISSGSTLNFKKTTTLKVMAVVGTAQSKVQTYTYTYREPLKRGIVVRFRKPESWNKVYFYAWQIVDKDSLGNPVSINVMGAYPGQRIYQDQEGWFSYEFSNDLDSINFCINSGDECGQLNLRSNDLMADYDVCYGWQEGADTLSYYENLLDCKSTVIDPDFDVVISPESGFFRDKEEGQMVKINVVGAEGATIHYTKSTDPEKTFTATDTVSFLITETTTVTAYADDGAGKTTPIDSVTYTYKEPQSGPITVRFIKPDDIINPATGDTISKAWPDLYLYAFTREKVGAKFKDTPYSLDGNSPKWPGMRWTRTEMIDDVEWHTWTMKDDIDEIYVIFNIGSNRTQTQDIYLPEDMCYVWSPYCWRAIEDPLCGGEIPEGLETMQNAESRMHNCKFLKGGELFIQVGDNVYDIFGRLR